MKNMKKAISVAVILPAVLLLFGCNAVEDDSRSPSMLVVESIRGEDIEGNLSDFLQSDVLRGDSVIADIATAVMRAETLDPNPLMGTSSFNDILLTRYTVSFTRTDKTAAVPGLDVPYPFEGSLSTLIRVGSSTSFTFVVVREVAKLEPPLDRLADGRAEGVLQCTAKIDFYGHDMANNNVKATGYLAVYFANYVDPEEETPTSKT